jgi:hypothetical protein
MSDAQPSLRRQVLRALRVIRAHLSALSGEAQLTKLWRQSVTEQLDGQQAGIRQLQVAAGKSADADVQLGGEMRGLGDIIRNSMRDTREMSERRLAAIEKRLEAIERRPNGAP